MARKKKPTDESQGWKFTRRDFLKYTSVATVAVATPTFLVACGKDGEIVGATAEPLDLSGLGIDWAVDVQRRDDLLVLNFGFTNLVKSGSPPRLQRAHSGPALIVVTLPPQHLLEQTILDGTSPPAASSPMQTAIAQPSRLVFAIPDGAPAIDYTLANLLTLIRSLGVNVNSNATGGAVDPHAPGTVSGGGVTPAHAPGPLETSIELPFRVLLSPNQYGRFAHASAPVSSRDRVELWHTRLATSATGGTPPDEKDAAGQRSARAMYTRDDDSPPSLGVLDSAAPLTAKNRRDIVTASLTSPPASLKLKQLALSSLGGWIDGAMDVPDGVSSGLERWVQRGAMGRDTHVEIIYHGFAFPFGHRLAYLVISDRRFDPNQGSGTPAQLYKTHVVMVREPSRDFPLVEDTGQDGQRSRMNPFRTFRFVTLRATVDPPNVDIPESTRWVPTVNGQPLRWECEGTDRRGRKIKLSPTIVWVPYSRHYADDDMRSYYAANAQPRTPTNGQRIALAMPRAQGDRDETSFENTSITFTGMDAVPPGSVVLPPRYYPLVQSTEIAVEALRATAGAGDVTSFRYPVDYVLNGFDTADGKNPREIFLELATGGTPIAANFGKQSDKSGGFIAPSLKVSGLSRVSGPVSEVGPAARSATVTGAGVFDPSMLPKLFGCVSLADVIGGGGGTGSLEQMAPKFMTKALNDAERLLDTAQRAFNDVQRLSSAFPGDLSAALPDSVPAGVRTQLIALGNDIRSQLASVQSKLATVVPLMSNLVALVGSPPPDLDTLVNAALPDDLLTTVAALNAKLNDPLASRLGSLLPGCDVLLRTIERFTRGMAEVAGSGAIAALRSAFLGFVRGLELVRDGSVHLEWRPPIREIPPFKPRPDGLLLSADIRTRQRGSEPAGVDLLCSLEDFRLDLEVINIKFNKLQFRQKSGKKPEIDVVLKDIEFTGILAFVETLKKIIPLDGFSDPPNIDVSPSGLRAGFTLPLPSIAVGVFSLEHIAISAELQVPFLGDCIAFRFAFCSRENPFVVTVAMLGGGGFFAITVTPKGVTALEAALEFGARLSINLGVASGSVEIMGGIYFSWHDTSGAMLQGYLRIRGEMDVLGLISASIELRMSLEYWFTEKKVIGRASIEIEISIAFFSTSVSVECERRFAGANGDPTFAELVGPLPTDLAVSHPWLDYWESFAA